MPSTNLYYRLVIDLPASSWVPGQTITANELVLTSSGSNNYILEPPTGDGQSIDPLTGKWSVGVYNIRIIDAVTSGVTRVITSQLADANARQQLISRPAFIQISSDGVIWKTLCAGFVNSTNLINAMTFEFTIGETRRLEETYQPFKNITLPTFVTGTLVSSGSSYQRSTAFIGGPIIGGFADKQDKGPWTMKVIGVGSNPDNYGVTLQFISGKVPTNQMNDFGQGTLVPYSLVKDSVPPDQVQRVQTLTRPFYQPHVPPRGSNKPGGIFKNCIARMTRVNNGQTYYQPFKVSDVDFSPLGSLYNFTVLAPYNVLLTTSGLVTVGWDTGSVGPYPTVGEKFSLYGLFVNPVSKDWPLYIEDHPVDIAAKLYDEVGITYTTASATSVKNQIPNVALALRVTDPELKLGNFLEDTVFGPFGISVRQNNSGSRDFITTRIRKELLPSESISINDLQNDSGIVFSVAEKDIVNKVIVEQERYYDWTPSSQVTRPADDILVGKDSHEIKSLDPSFYGAREVKYTIGGTFETITTVSGNVSRSAFSPEHFRDFSEGVASEVFDRFLRGVITTEGYLLTNITSSVGDEIIVNFSHMPNALMGQSPISQRGGNRLMQIIQRTEGPIGPYLRLWDSGDTAQSTLIPTCSLALGGDARRFFTVQIANSGSISQAGAGIRLEVGAGNLQPSGGIQTFYSASVTLDVLSQRGFKPGFKPITSTIYPPQQNAGTKVWVRGQAVPTGSVRRSPWSVWSALQLTPLNPVTSATSSVFVGGATVSWSLGEVDIPVNVFLREAALPAASSSYIRTLPELSNRTLIDTPSASIIYTVGLQHTERLPYTGTSALVEYSFTSSASPRIIRPPINPRAFAGGNVKVLF